jgi:DNA ligase (NAD+)
MHKQEAKNRAGKLRSKIDELRYRYHVLDDPKVSDDIYDSLTRELKKIEHAFPEVKTSDSPTERIGGKALDKFVKVPHSQRMLSLNDAFNFAELEAWEKRICRLLPADTKFAYFAEVKLDGLAVALTYEEGFLKTGATRGDGLAGEDVTQNLKTIHAIPLKLRNSSPPKRLEVRGEVYIKKKDFAQLNQEQKRNDAPAFANPRNTAAGAIRQLDAKVAAAKKLSFYAYDLVTDLGQKTHQASHKLARQLGLPVTPHAERCAKLAAVERFYQKIYRLRAKLPYQIDGIVVNVNSIDVYKKLGIVGKAPRGAVAYKFPAERATTQILDIQLQVGRTGALTPVAIMQPVQVAGSTVSRATLHNEDEIARLGVKIGDTVVIQKAGDIIPDVVEVLKDLRTGKEKNFHWPKQFMGSPVTRKKGEAAHYVTDGKLPVVQREKFYHFVSKKAFDIAGLGPKIIDALLDSGLVNDAADIFKLNEKDLAPLERFAEKSAENLVASIEKAKKQDLARFIYALGIRHVGEETAILLAQNAATSNQQPVTSINFIKAFQTFSLEQLEAAHDIGPVVAKSIFDYFQDKGNIELIERLFKNGVNIKSSQPAWPTGGSSVVGRKLSGKTFVLTGTLNKMTRDEAKQKIRSAGGSVSAAVSKNTNFLVAGEKPGSKYDKAKKLDIKIIDEEMFGRLVD